MYFALYKNCLNLYFVKYKYDGKVVCVARFVCLTGSDGVHPGADGQD